MTDQPYRPVQALSEQQADDLVWMARSSPRQEGEGPMAYARRLLGLVGWSDEKPGRERSPGEEG